MPYSPSTKVVIIGSGVFGLSSAYHLVKNGYKNIEIFDRTDYEETKYYPLKGSDAASGDINKFFRIYYENKTLYSKLAIEALETWEAWNKDIWNLSPEEKARFIDEDLELVRLTGGLRIGDAPELPDVERSNLKGFEELGLRATQYDLNDENDVLRAKLTGNDRKLEVVRDLLSRQKTAHISGTFDSIGRMLKADKACFYVKILLEKAGVKFHYGIEGTFKGLVQEGSKVTGIETADSKIHLADLVIASAGSWTTSLVSQLRNRTQASLANIIYIQIPKDRQDLIDKYSNYPHIQWKTTSSENDRNQNHENGEGGFAFFPPTRTEGILKLNTRQIKFLNPIRIGDNYISVPKTLGSERLPKSVIQEAKDILLAIAPDLARVENIKLQSKLFWYTDAINSDFIIDFVPNLQNFIVATGGSAHAFKFLPVLGKTVVDRLQGKDNDYTDLFRWKNPDDILVDNYGLKNDHIERDERRKFDNAVLLDETDLGFTGDDLNKLDTIKLA